MAHLDAEQTLSWVMDAFWGRVILFDRQSNVISVKQTQHWQGDQSIVAETSVTGLMVYWHVQHTYQF